VATKDRLREALTACDRQVKARLREAFRHLRPELKRLFQGYGICPENAEKLLEEVARAV
jgi:chromosome segregation ATPase